MNRREALTRLGGFMAAGLVGFNKSVSASTSDTVSAATPPVSSESITIAHITDVHLESKLNAEKWFAKCLHHIQSNPRKPKLILNTGDSVMETLTVDRPQADHLWKIWRNTLSNENSLPIYQCLGNHDHWGLGLPPEVPAKTDPHYGKKLGLEGIGLERGYHSTDAGNWHLIALDSILPVPSNNKPGWTGMLDEEQFQWLRQDLENTPKERPVLVYSHIPILQVCSFKNLKPMAEPESGYNLRPHVMMADARRIIDLFEQHPNVKLCLSGHMHLQDRVELSGVTYICDGAVSGSWWKGVYVDCPPGYSTITLHPDGKFDYNYETYGWAAEGVVPA